MDHVPASNLAPDSPARGEPPPGYAHVAPLSGARLRGLAERVREAPADKAQNVVLVTGESGYRFQALLLQLSSRGIALRVPFPYDRELSPGGPATVQVTVNGQNHLVSCTVLDEEPIADGTVVALALSGAALDVSGGSGRREHALASPR